MTDYLKLAEQYLRERILPSIKVTPKQDSLVQRIVGYLLYIPTGGSYMTNFWTTLGNTVYKPSSADTKDWQVLFHEAMHIRQEDRDGKILHSLKYAFPQVLAPIAVISLLLLGLGWWSLLGLVLLGPIPAWWRSRKELEAYTFQACLMELHRTNYGKGVVSYFTKMFSGSAYLFMWPFRKSINKHITEAVLSVHQAYEYGVYPVHVTDRFMWDTAARFMEEHSLVSGVHVKME